jgi:choline dehydrogenase-like flavoprotein
VLTNALVTRITVEKARAAAVEVLLDGTPLWFAVGRELVLSLGAIQTPKILMQSGIGDADELRQSGIDIVQHLPGVGRNLQEHVLIGGCVWEYRSADQWRGSGAEATLFWKSDTARDTPDLQAFVIDGPFLSPETSHLNTAASCWSITPGVVRPRSQGRRARRIDTSGKAPVVTLGQASR